MELSQAFLRGSEYCQKRASCRTLVSCATFQELRQIFVGRGGKSVKSCKNCRNNRRKSGNRWTLHIISMSNLRHTKDFIEVVSSFLERQDTHIFSPEAQSLKLRVTRE
ncbi:hypothetical protein V1508DRAFT_43198 [Lipomyces doorenjongii]|uniref:uncharacterized protein n=1 Tax=Lipomyces doorenjongii TaxID=383834 RepID=UPI0034CE0459